MSGKASLLRRFRRACLRLGKAYKAGACSVKQRDGTWHGYMVCSFKGVGPVSRRCNQLMKRIDPTFRKDFTSYDVGHQGGVGFLAAHRGDVR